MEDQQIPPEPLPPGHFFTIAFDTATRAHVRQAAAWAKVCTICAFIGYGITLVVAIFARRGGYSMEMQRPGIGAFVKAGNILGVLLATAVGVVINYFLYRFAAATARGMDRMDIGETNEGFKNLRAYFKVYGVLLILALSVLALILFIALLALGFNTVHTK